MPGQIFTHRNIANQVQINDPNGISVLTYAVAELGVEHIIVAGHTRCGGVAVCLDHATDKALSFNAFKPDEEYSATEPKETTSWPPPPPLDIWLTPLRELAESFPQPPIVLGLVKENARQQVRNLVQTDVVKKHWPTGATGCITYCHLLPVV